MTDMRRYEEDIQASKKKEPKRTKNTQLPSWRRNEPSLTQTTTRALAKRHHKTSSVYFSVLVRK
jgi:hypothetical protein